MFDMSWGEVLVIGAVALIVIGPKDLPKALRTLGNMTSQVKKMASEFQSQFNEAMREAELDDIKKEVAGLNEQVSAFNPLGTIHDELKGAIESTPAANAAAAAPDGPTAEPPASADAAAAAPLPGEPAFDLALPAPPPALSGPLPEPVDAAAAAGPVPAESPKA
jgi:sec-independent protein translocase protein TatB